MRKASCAVRLAPCAISVKDIIFSLSSAILLSLPFFSGRLWVFAWIGFVPLFFVLQDTGRAKAFLLSYITGIIFWSITIYWLIHVTLLGQILLILYLALYFGLFGFLISAISHKLSVVGLLSIPALWVFLEYTRGHLFTGFGWALLGYSQYLNLPVIQIADLFGAYGVSFLVMMVNVAIYLSCAMRLPPCAKKPKIFLLSIVCFLVTLGYGYYSLLRTTCESAAKRILPEGDARPATLKISVIQGNIPQELKWAYISKPFILEKYIRLTNEAAKASPDLIIWPEASSPGLFGEEEDEWVSRKIFAACKDIGIPVLFGSAVREKEKYFNSALLIGADGALIRRHDKLHLVPFGEYIPLKKIFPFLETIVPIGDFTKGKEYTLLNLSAIGYRLSAKFAVLICFEDTVPELSRDFVKKGADFLVNITNDAWFGKTSSPYQHLSASVFRAVENRVPLVRSANTGVSCFIDSRGRITARVSENSDDIFIDGVKTGAISLGKRKSVYSGTGDIFVLGCLAIAAICGIIKKYRCKSI